MSPVAPRTRPAPAWSATAIAALLDTLTCPVCGAGEISERRCRACRADFTGPVGGELWGASQTAADALRARQAVLERVPFTALAPAALTADQATGAAASAPLSPAREAVLAGPGRSATVQSVLAVAGAGLVAIAAVVFTFFNPDLTDPLPRALIVGSIAAVFLAGAALLSRRRLRFSAEAIGALGVVFLALTVSAVAPLVPGLGGWTFAGVAALAGGAGLVALARLTALRSWLWSALVALTLVPAMLALDGGSMLATGAGCLASAAAASALVTATTRLAPAFDGRLYAERVTLTVVQFGFILTAIPLFPLTRDTEPVHPFGVLSATLACVAVLAVCSARHPAGGVWSVVAGAAAVASGTALALALLPAGSAGWLLGLLHAAAGAMLVVVGALRPLHRAATRGALFGGAIAALAAVAVLPTMTAFLSLAALLLGRAEFGLLPADIAVGLTLGLAAVAAALMGFAAVAGAADAAGAAGAVSATGAHAPGVAGDLETPVAPLGTRWLGHVGGWYAVLAALTVLCLPGVTVWGRVVIGLALGITVGALLVGPLRDAAAAVRLPLVVGAHAAVVLAGVMSWSDPSTTIWAGIVVVAATGVLAMTVPAPQRFVHAGTGFAYALVVLATALARAGLEPVVVLCLTTCAAGVVSIVATFAPRVPTRSWYAVLVVTAVPFAIGVAQVVIERSGWTALSTGVIFLLALTLTATRRPGLGAVVRTLAAGMLVPSLAVVMVCLGAQFLVMSGSPVVLPVIAAIVAAVLPAGGLVQSWLTRRIPARQARLARLGIEVSALLTAAIAVGLTLVREAAGLETTLVVLVLLGVGFAATARYADRRYGWWLAGAAFTGALWSGWGLAGVTGLEPYLLPPTLGAAAVGVLLTARGRTATGLYAAGLTAAVVPVLLAQTLTGTGAAGTGPAGLGVTGTDIGWADAAAPSRAYALVAAAWVLVVCVAVIGRASSPAWRRLRVLRAPSLAVAIVAASAAAVQGARWGVGLDPAPALGIPLVVTCLALGAVGAGAAALAARGLRAEAEPTSLRARTRWLAAPAVLYVAVAAWPAIQRDWFSIWTMWGLMIAFLSVMVAVAARALRGPTGLPPVWFLFAVSFVTGIVAWSPRDLRVEWFSLPLGLFLLTAGALAMRGAAPAPAPTRTLTSWPAGWTGSWALLAPGLAVMLSASVAATYTDPRTWRAILVMAIALVAILVGATRRLAAPFLIGIVALPVENVLAFMLQIGRGIQAMPWWITLSVVGAVLLIIAVGYERRTGDDAGLAARLRDLA